MNNSLYNGQNLVAVLLIAIGGGFFLQQLGLWDFGSIIGQWWPLAVIAFGLMEFLKSGQRSYTALFIIGLGVALQAARLMDTDINIWTLIWPGILIFAGLSLLLRKGPSGLTADKSVNEFVIFGGTEKQFKTKDFEGGSTTAVFGGSKIDLRNSTIVKSARLDVLILFGGLELIVPEGCRVVNQSMAIFGGAEDKTRPDEKSDQVITVTGTILFGGIEIKN